MNRADRRRQEKLAATTGPTPAPFALRHLLEEGKEHHQAGRLVEAERAYRMALEMAPEHPEALHLMGLLAYRAGRFDLAIDLLRQATGHAPSAPLYWFNLGVVTQRAGHLDEAAQAYRQALSLNRRYVEACINLGNVLKDQGALADAVETYRRALALNSSHADTHNNLGVAFKEQGQLDAAIASYRHALRLAPAHIEALNNLGLALMECEAIDEAVASFEQALAAAPQSLKSLYNLGIARIWKGQHDNAVACLRQAAEAKHNHGSPVRDSWVYRSRIKHDAEQVRVLLEHGLLPDEHRPYCTALERLHAQLDRRDAPGNRVQIDSAALQSIAPSFNRFLYLAPCERLPERALHPDLNVREIEDRYLATHPEVAYIDGLLTPDALTALRRFCWESTIWKKD